MVKKQEKEDKLKITIGGSITVACTIVGLIIKFAVEICDNLFLKFLVIVLFSLALISALYIFNQTLNTVPRLFRYIAYLAAMIFYLILSVFVYNKQCIVPKREVTEIRQGNVDNSVHADNRKNYYSTKQVQRSLKDKDVRQLRNQIPVMTARILVQYLQSKAIDTLLSRQIVNKLTDLGYADVHLSPATSLPGGLKDSRITVLKNINDTVTVYKVIIIPQP